MVSKLDASSMTSVRSLDRREPLRREAPEPGASARTGLRDPDLRVSLSAAARRLALAPDAEAEPEGLPEPSAPAADTLPAASAYRDAPRPVLGRRLDLRV